jgi:hypothetical protein
MKLTKREYILCTLALLVVGALYVLLDHRKEKWPCSKDL